MKLELPDIKIIIPRIWKVKSRYDGKELTIQGWVELHRKNIQKNKSLIPKRSEKNDIKILNTLLTALLIRAMRGEAGRKISISLNQSIRSKSDLKYKVYLKLLESAQYRWGAEKGAVIIRDVVKIFEQDYQWNWKDYFDEGEKHAERNFPQDKILQINNIGMKVRDLALSSFSEKYIANDLHVVRVMTRIGLLNYGFDLTADSNLEMGNNPGNEKNYLFLHKLVLKISKKLRNKISPADLDRTFWHFGRTVCSSTPKCNICPIKIHCLSGKHIK